MTIRCDIVHPGIHFIQLMLDAHLEPIRIVDLLLETLGDHAIDLHLEALRLPVVHLILDDRFALSNLDALTALDARLILDIRETSPTEIQTTENFI